VEDSGPGIPEFEREQVFERFHRVRGTPGQGTGLGLAIVREIADRHRGSVDIRTPASGTGTVVTVSFPAPGGRP
jgi:two-component system sensor histidine kinase TctE